MRSFSLLFVVVVALFSLTLAGPALASDVAAEDTAAETAPDLERVGRSALCPAPAPSLPTTVPAAAAAQCTADADCEDGTTRWCQDTTSPAECTAVDQDCANGVRGYVQCNEEPRIYCPICEDCTGVKQCNPCGNAPPKCGCVCVRGACGRIDAWVCL